MDWGIRFCGYRLGLWTGYPEFLDLTLKQLNAKIPLTGNSYTDRYYLSRLSELASDVGRYSGEISPEQWAKIKQTILDSNIPRLASYIISSFSGWRQETPEFKQLCYDLAQDDRAYIWWQAIYHIIQYEPNKLEPFESLPEKIKLHSAMAGYQKADSRIAENAKEILPTLFTNELLTMNRNVWYTIRSRLISQYDRKIVTKVFIDFLRQFVNHSVLNNPNNFLEYNNSETAAWLIRPINAWYGLNFGGFGTSEYSVVQVNGVSKLKAIIKETINWYDTNPQVEPLDLAFFKGQVVDSNAKPIPDAIITLKWNQTEWITRDSGRIIGQKTEKYKTDSNGNFNIGKLSNERQLQLEVEANGFVPKKDIYIQQQPYGSFRLSPGRSDSNMIMLLRSQ